VPSPPRRQDDDRRSRGGGLAVLVHHIHFEIDEVLTVLDLFVGNRTGAGEDVVFLVDGAVLAA